MLSEQLDSPFASVPPPRWAVFASLLLFASVSVALVFALPRAPVSETAPVPVTPVVRF